MKTIIKTVVEKEVDIKTLRIFADVRYWEDAKVNGVEDTDGTLIPFREGDIWQPEIDIDTGIIREWPTDVEAKVHYKVCDSGSYYLLDSNMLITLKIEGDYVPNRLIPGECDDYIVMTIDGTGKIAEWDTNPDFSDFTDREED